jgi:hypothetical protein
MCCKNVRSCGDNGQKPYNARMVVGDQVGAIYRPRPWLARKVLGVMKRLGLRRSIPDHTHSHGMVGLVKELVDEQGAADVASKRRAAHRAGPRGIRARSEDPAPDGCLRPIRSTI